MKRRCGVSAFQLTLMLAAGCAARPAVVTPAARPAGADATAVLRNVLADHRGIATMRAKFHARVAVHGEERSATGVLVVDRPDRFRMRLVTPFGLTAFDYLQRGERIWVSQPLRSGDAAGAESLRMFSERGMGAAFLGRYQIDPRQCRIESQTALCTEPAGHEIGIDLERAVIVFDRSDEVTVRYRDHRRDGEHSLPYRIEIEAVVRNPAGDLGRVEVAVDIDTYEINVALGDALFAPPPEAAAE